MEPTKSKVKYPYPIGPGEQAFLNGKAVYGYVKWKVVVWSQTNPTNTMAIAAFNYKKFKAKN